MPSKADFDSLSAVRTFVHVVDAGSLSEAGRRVGLTPSAVSKQLSRLEESLGVRLLERTTRSIRATDAGLELCQRARPLFEAFAEATAAARERRGEIRGRLRVSASPALGRARVVPILAGLAARHPGLDFDVVLSGQRLDFFEDQLDLAIREGSLDDSSLVARRLGSAAVVLCASRKYLASRTRVRNLGDLERHDLLLVPAAETMRDLGALRGPGGERVKLKPRFRVNDLFALRDLAEAGAGIAALPDYLAREAIASKKLVHVLPAVRIAEIPIHAVWPSRRHLPRRVELAVDALAAGLQALAAGRSR